MSWVDALQEACAKSSQAAVARELKVSPATVNLILKENYNGDMDRMEQLVRGKYMHETVACPVQNEISINKCLEDQSKPFSGHNPLRVRLFKACQTCPHNKKNKGK